MEMLFKLDHQKCFPVGTVDACGSSTLSLSLDDEIDETIEFLKILGKSIDLIDSKYENMMKCLGLSREDLFYSIPTSVMRSRLKDTLELTRVSLEDTDNKAYLVTYLTIKRFLRGLSRARIDKMVLQNLIGETENVNVSSRLKAFMPPAGTDLLKKSTYSMSKTATGRLTVIAGPQILTLNSDARCIFKSSFSEGKVLQIDLVAAEPNIALKMFDKSIEPPDGDVYQHLSNVVFDQKISRDLCKLITLCVLYGQSSKNIEKKLPSNLRSQTVIRKTRDFFNVSYLEKMLYQNFKSKNLRNALGRPINLGPDDARLCLNYFLQSSAAEISVLMFSEWCKKNASQSKPIYVIHDALIVDCDERLSRKLLKDRVIDLSIGGWTLKAKVTQVSNI